LVTPLPLFRRSLSSAALVVTLLVIATAVAGSWRGWQWYEGNQAVQARGYFEALEEAGRQQGDCQRVGLLRICHLGHLQRDDRVPRSR
jgi:hypothetical protein